MGHQKCAIFGVKTYLIYIYNVASIVLLQQLYTHVGGESLALFDYDLASHCSCLVSLSLSLSLWLG